MGLLFQIRQKDLNVLRRLNDDIIGASQFPTGTQGTGRPKNDPITGKTDAWSCKQCGMGCLADRVTSPGTANQGDGNILNDASTGDPTLLRGGCPFCGTANSRR